MQNNPPSSGAPNYSPSGMPQGQAPKSKKPWIIGGLVGCLLLIIIIVLAVGGLAYLGFKKAEETAKSINTNTPAARQASNTKQYVNSRAGRSGKLADNLVDFSLHYPANWAVDDGPAPH